MIPIEFYKPNSDEAFLYAEWPAVPRVGDKMGVYPAGVTLTVKEVSWDSRVSNDDENLLIKLMASVTVE